MQGAAARCLSSAGQVQQPAGEAACNTWPMPGTPGPQGSVSCPGSCHRPGDEAHPPLTSRRLHPMGQLCTLFTSHWHTGITSPPYPLNTRSETHSENHCVWRGSQLLVLTHFLWPCLKKHRVFWFSYVRSAQESAVSRASPQEKTIIIQVHQSEGWRCHHSLFKAIHLIIILLCSLWCPFNALSAQTFIFTVLLVMLFQSQYYFQIFSREP